VPTRLAVPGCAAAIRRSDVRCQGAGPMTVYQAGRRRWEKGSCESFNSSIRSCGREFPLGAIVYSVKRDQSAGVAVASSVIIVAPHSSVGYGHIRPE
jgi:hypothetical protein